MLFIILICIIFIIAAINYENPEKMKGTDWALWFAWYPVNVAGKGFTWLMYVKRSSYICRSSFYSRPKRHWMYIPNDEG